MYFIFLSYKRGSILYSLFYPFFYLCCCPWPGMFFYTIFIGKSSRLQHPLQTPLLEAFPNPTSFN